jgi:DNA-binding SARP family transcriptional activator
MLAADSCLEEAHVRLMRCYSRQGQHYLALRQYDRCAKVLEEELEVPPMSETIALHELIRAGERI